MCRTTLLSKSGGVLFVTTLAQLLTVTNGSSCRYSYYSSCKVNPKSATYEVTFSVDSVESNADIDKYPVTATFHWGVANTTKVGEYQPGKDVKISDTYIYDSNGYYTTGISLSFGEGAAGCTGSTLSEYDTFYLGGTSCDYGVDTPPPTPKPTSKPQPTPEPTDKPVTTFPTVKETPEPSPEPTNAPTTPEPVTTTTTTVAATTTTTTTSVMATTEPSPSSNVSPTTAATTTTATTTSSATNSATASTASSASSTTTTTTASVATTSSSTGTTSPQSPQQQTVRSRMTLYNSAELDDKALSKWEKKTIQQILTHNAENADVMTVTLDNISQEEAEGGQQRSLRRRFLLRHLTGEEGPLTIDFDAIVKSDESSSLTAQDANDIVSAGFSTSARQTEYIYSLKSADSSVFGGIGRMVMVVDGTTLETSSGGGNTGIDGVQRPEDGGGGNGSDPANNGGGSMGAIIGGVVGGALVLFVVVGSILYSRRRQHETSTSGSFSKDTKGVGDDIMGKEWSTRTGNDSPDAQTCATPYLGTIESREGEDDVSTLGDPYFGEAINASDTGTVAESMISSDMLALGVKRNKGFSSNASRMDATTATGYTSGVGSAYPMTFADDTTLDDAYQTPADLEYGEEDDEDYERVVVVAPSGKLGIVIDNPSGGIPFVHAIKESSVLHGKVFVGDLVLSVDEVDCRGMHSLAVSKLISKRSENPARTLSLLRNST